MLHIKLHHLIFTAYHGIHPEERILGNTFEVNMELGFDEQENNFEKLEDTIDYSKIYEIIRNRIQEPTALLEKICLEIIQDTKNKFPIINEMLISIYKLNMPIENFQGKIGVEMRKKF